MNRIILLVILTVLLIASSPIIKMDDQKAIKPPGDFTRIYNPASLHCIKSGYVLEIRENENGAQIGFCINEYLECSEWMFFVGICSLDLGPFRIK